MNDVSLVAKFTVGNVLQIVVIPEIISEITVISGTPKATVISRLPQSVNVRLEDGTYADVGIRWSSETFYAQDDLRYHSFTGTLMPPPTIGNLVGYGFKVTANMVFLDKGDEILQNGDFNDGPWSLALADYGTTEIIYDPLNPFGPDAPAMLVNSDQALPIPFEDVTDAVWALGDGYYLLEVWVRAEYGSLDMNAIMYTTGVSRKHFTQRVTINDTEYTKISAYILYQREDTDTAVWIGLSTEREPAANFIIAHASFRFIGDEADVAAWERDILTVDMILAVGDTVTSVTEDLTLPLVGRTAAYWVTQDPLVLNKNPTPTLIDIVWLSGNPAVIANTGVVTRSTTNVYVELTAIFNFEGETAEQIFSLLVLGTRADLADAIAYVQALILQL